MARPRADSCQSTATGTAGNHTEIPHDQHDEVLARIGQLTRTLHESLRGLGMDRMLERAAHNIPDARERLAYVAAITEQAAQRALNATEAAMPLQHGISSGAVNIADSWQSAVNAPFSEVQYRALAEQTVTYLHQTRDAAQETRDHLLDIMMAQDFQDLTGQVIRKVTEVAHDIELQLVQLLVDYAPEQARRHGGDADDPGRAHSNANDDNNSNGLLNGPQINPAGKLDVVADQKQVDDLLADLGF